MEFSGGIVHVLDVSELERIGALN
ncbi:hypothetical protein [Afipia birgiae]|nr:hypothetical protein [Afipia birgiae]